LVDKLSVGRTVINLADPMVRERAMWQPEAFIKLYDDTRFVLKNIQFVPRLLEVLCSDVVSYHCIAVMSQAYYIMEEYSELKGMIVVDLPVSLREECLPFLPVTEQINALPQTEMDAEEVFSNIFNGSLLDDATLSQQERKAFYGAYVQNFLQHDIKMATPVSDEMKFYRFVCNVAANVGNVLNYALLGNTVDVSSPTAKLWMSYLEGAGIVTLLYPIDDVNLKRVAKAPKIYFNDTGLASYLLRLQSPFEIAGSAFADGLLENWVVLRLRNGYLQNGVDVKLSYFKDSNAKEINLLLHYNDCVYPIDIKKDTELSIKKQLKKFKLISNVENDAVTKIGNGCVISICREVKQLDEKLWLIPVGVL
ncbi:MAG: DUF4143 domain-containing protein, partial [Phascolarctobacterium sp.]|nr:DUF4143 domain-containing protein [Phascolarctobacterium sp.]